MTMKSALLVLATLVLCACSQEPARTDTGAIKQQIQQREAQWNAAFNERDAAALAGMFADDAALATPGERLIRGREAIDEAMRSLAADPNLKMTFSANRIEVAESGDLAYSRGNFTMTTTDPQTNTPLTSSGRYLTVWQKQPDGSWKALEDFITPGEAAVSQKARAIL